MVKPGVYTTESEKEKELKKDALEKVAFDIVPPIITIVPGGKGEASGCCCTKRKVLVALLILILVGIAVVAGGLTYKYMSHHGEPKKRNFDCHVEFDKPHRGKQEGNKPVDEVPVPDVKPDIPERLPEDKPHPTLPPRHRPTRPPRHRPHPPRHRPEPTEQSDDVGSVDEEIEVDEYNRTEKFEIPANEQCERITIIHDFNKGVSGYRLWTSNYCFVKRLDVGSIPPFILSALMMDPNYLRDHFEMVRENYLAVPPPIDFRRLVAFAGEFIASRCVDVPTYFLEPDVETDEPELPVEPEVPRQEESESLENVEEELEEPEERYPLEETDGNDDWMRSPHRRQRRASKEELSALKKLAKKESKITFFDGGKVREIQIKHP
ncbi:uncharacterized protein LOC144433634 [Glandiceps talaboti]